MKFMFSDNKNFFSIYNYKEKLMKKKNFKNYILFGSLILLFLFTLSCGNNNSSDDESEVTINIANTNNALVDLEVSHPAIIGLEIRNLDTLEKNISLYLQSSGMPEETGITITVTNSSENDGLTMVFRTSDASNQPSDTMELASGGNGIYCFAIHEHEENAILWAKNNISDDADVKEVCSNLDDDTVEDFDVGEEMDIEGDFEFGESSYYRSTFADDNSKIFITNKEK